MTIILTTPTTTTLTHPCCGYSAIALGLSSCVELTTVLLCEPSSRAISIFCLLVVPASTQNRLPAIQSKAIPSMESRFSLTMVCTVAGLIPSKHSF